MTEGRTKKRHPIKSTFLSVAVGLNVFVAIFTIFSAYGGVIDPDKMVVAAMVAMTLPAFLLLGLVLVIIDLVFWRRLALVQVVAWLVAAPPIINFSPLNFTHRKLSRIERERKFTFLTYNVLHFWDFRGDVPGLERNASLDYILASNADIVNLQEVGDISLEGPWKVTPEQLYELHTRYPYGYLNAGKELTILSKYPVEHVHLDLPPYIAERVVCFRLDVMGDTINLFSVHLESIGLSPEDKELYMQLYKPSTGRKFKEELAEVKTKLISKLSAAFRNRAEQARALRACIDSIGGNVIVAGDFNDIPDCYAIRTIKGNDLKDAYAECALGPAITYHGNRFYFRIDHVLYDGNIEAVRIRRPKIPSSDHYPLLTTFVINPDKTN